jgi:ribose transport system ATP-binding protein
MTAPALAATGIKKRFGGVVALDGAEFTLETGEIHALLGANGSGKSTLCKIIAGAVGADTGELSLDGHAVTFACPADAAAAGIELFYQELSLIPAMSVAENIYLGREPVSRFGLVDGAARRAQTKAVLAQLGEALGPAIDPDTPVAALTPDQRQLVEILKVLERRARIVIFDEPTAALDRRQVAILFTHLAKLREQGQSIVFISHRIDEVFAIADRITVMRNGRTALALPIAEATRDEIVGAMAGGSQPTRSEKRRRPLADQALRVADLAAGKLAGISMNLRRGEIVGLGGLQGQGQSDFLRALYGAMPIAGGTIDIGETRFYPKSPVAAMRRGMAYVSGERTRYGILATRPIFENLVQAVLVRDRRFVVARRRLEAVLAPVIARLAVKFPSLSAPASQLSGGNQQKIVIGRALAVDPMILLLDDPTKGIDIGTRADLYTLLDELCAQGVAILLYSSDDEELLTVSDRILVFNDGRIVADLAGEDRTELALYRAAYDTVHAGAQS